VHVDAHIRVICTTTGSVHATSLVIDMAVMSHLGDDALRAEEPAPQPIDRLLCQEAPINGDVDRPKVTVIACSSDRDRRYQISPGADR
jgi:hypothetical protein